MKLTRIFFLMVFMVFGVADAHAQKKRESNKVTPKSAMEKEAKAREEKEAQYIDSKDHHKKVQDKATRKRMKKNLKKAERHSWGKDVPWYKRWFRRGRK